MNVRFAVAVPVMGTIAIAFAACGHTEPFGPSAPPPFGEAATAGAPLRLTYEVGEDGFPSWSPDGRQILYAFQPRDRHDADRCIGIMPKGGGTRQEFCDNAGPGATRTDALEYPTVNAAGRDSIFFTRTGDNRLYVVPLGGSTARVVYSLPQQLPGRREIRNPVRVGEWVAAITQGVDTSQPPRFTAGLAPNAKLELIRTADGTSQVLRNGAGQVPAFGRLAVSPDGCTLVVEFREPRRISFTTDLYAICLDPGGSCSCT